MLRYFKCMRCGNIIEKIEDSGVTPVCCNQTMTELIPGTSDGAHEKHVPVLSADEMDEASGYPVRMVIVHVGSVEHPMTEQHYIQWITLETDKGVYRHKLTSSMDPEAAFLLHKEEEILGIYAYCNLHGLWKA